MFRLTNLPRTLRTLRYLRVVQLWYLLRYKFRSRGVVHVPSATRHNRKIVDIHRFPPSSYCNTLGSRICLLGESREIRWHATDYPKLWLYNLHYFDYIRGSAIDSSLISDWIKSNPCPEGVGWDPYPLSRRIVNWCKLIAENRTTDQQILDSIAQQAKYLSNHIEFHLFTNHLFANIKALLVASLIIESPDSCRLRCVAERLLWDELNEQFFSDGGHVERSPMYHATMLEDVLDMINFGRAYDWPGASALARRVPKMLGWLERLSWAGGEPMHFNDSVAGVACDIRVLADYANRLGIEVQTVQLSDSGFLDLLGPTARIVMDGAPPSPTYQPGHAHAQALCLEAEVEGRPLLVNSGISTYERGSLRSWQRSTAAHNTVVIDGQNSAEVWSAFRLGRRPHVSSRRIPNGIIGQHDGYRFLPGRPLHSRMCTMQENGFAILDRIEGRGTHQISANWLIHPDVSIDTENKILRCGEFSVTVSFDGPVTVRFEPATYWLRFGEERKTSRVVCDYDGSLPIHFTMKINRNSA